MISFEAPLNALADAKVKFVIVGAYAGVAHGSVQVTQDLDVCYERTPENIKRLAAALAPFHPRLRGISEDVPFVLDERALAQGMNFTLQTDVGELDLLGQLSGVGQFQDAAKDAVWIEIFGKSHLVASLDVVIRSKRAAGRPKDLTALPELEALRELQKKPK